MRESIKSLVEIFARTYKIGEPIYEFGSYQVEGQEGFADLRPHFPGKRYVGCDNREGPGVDQVLDVQALNLPWGSVGAAICVDTLEHVEYARRSINEMHRVLDGNGILLITSVMNFRIHSYPDDFWRFTPSGFKSLLNTFAHSFVGSVGQDLFPHTVVGVGFKSAEFPEEHVTFVAEFMDWKKKYK